MRLTYTMTTLGRTSVGAGPEVGNTRSGLAVVPGSTVRGSLAAVWAVDHHETWGAVSQRFADLFEHGATFHQAVPEGYEMQPLSWVRCKYPTSICAPGWRDLAREVVNGETPPDLCPTCRGVWAAARGWAPSRLGGSLVATTRVALHADGTAREGELYTRRGHEVGTRMTGTLVLPVELLAEAAWFRTERRLRVGGQRSVAGAVRWTAADDDPAGDGTPAAERAVLRLLSPTIFTDEYGGPTTDLLPALRAVLGPVEIVARWLRPERVNGWHAASGLAKPEEWALAAGSTVVLDHVPADAGELLAGGLGLRRHEGFGQIEIGQPLEPSLAKTAPHQTRTEGAGPSSAQPSLGSTGGPKPEVPTTPSGGALEVGLERSLRGRVLAGIASVPLTDQQLKLAKAVSEDALGLARLRRTHASPTQVQQRIAQVLNRPVMAGLPPDATEAIERALRELDADEIRAFGQGIQRQWAQR